MTAITPLLPMVNAAARRFRSRVYGICDREDLFQEGVVGLLEAATRYETGHGCSLATFGAKRVNGAMLDHVRKLARRSVERADDKLAERRTKAFAATTRSMESRVMLLRIRHLLKTGVPGMAAMELETLRLRYRDGLTVRDVGDRLKVSAATVVRLEAKALAQLREMISLGHS